VDGNVVVVHSGLHRSAVTSWAGIARVPESEYGAWSVDKVRTLR